MTATRRLRAQILDLQHDLIAVCDDTGFELFQLEETMDELLIDATEIAELAEQSREDFRQAADGNTRVTCPWCDGQIYVPCTRRGPHTCPFRRHCDGS